MKRNTFKEDKAMERFAEMMIGKIETIRQNWKKPWFTKSALLWPQNFDGREYNGSNALLLAMVAEDKGYEVPVWCTFNRVTSLNYEKDPTKGYVLLKDKDGKELPYVMVNKGEKSMPVMITVRSVVNSETDEHIDIDAYCAMSEEEQANYRVYPKTMVYNVFNIAQTNIAETRPELYAKIKARAFGEREETNDSFTFPAMDEMIAENKWCCPIKPTYGDRAYYSVAKDEVVIPEKKQFINGESFYSNLWHEMAHSTGIASRLNRYNASSLRNAEESGREELVAELTAALVGIRFGLQKNIKADSCAYIKSWLESLKKEPAFIKTVLNDVRKAASYIINAIEELQPQEVEEVEMEIYN